MNDWTVALFSVCGIATLTGIGHQVCNLLTYWGY